MGQYTVQKHLFYALQSRNGKKQNNSRGLQIRNIIIR